MSPRTPSLPVTLSMVLVPAVLIAASALVPISSPTALAQDFPPKIADQYGPTDRPHIYGCGVFWGTWYGMEGEKQWEWNARSMDAIAAMGGTNVGAGPNWYDCEKVRGVYDWERADRSVALALERGLEIFCYNGSTPQWALPDYAPRDASGNFVIHQNHRYPPDEKYIADFERFYETMARRYRGKVKYYQFWNEPNGCSWINDNCSNSHMAHTYVPWLKRWYAAMKRGDADCVLSVGGIDYHSGVREGWRYFEDIYTHGGGDSFDAVAIHPYGEPLNWQAIHDTYACLVRHGDGHKKIWVNEYGWNTQNEEKKAENLVAVLNELKKPEYHMVFQANHLVLTDLNKDGHDYGLCGQDPENLVITPRASYEAFKAYDKSFPPNADRPPDDASIQLAPPPPPPAGKNLLRNPNFEEDFVEAPELGQGEPIPLRANEWDLWGGNWWTRSGGDGHLNHSPFGAQSAGTNWGTIENAVYQRVRVTPGNTYQFSAWTRVDAEGDDPVIERAVGLDPTGGVNPRSYEIHWSSWDTDQESWQLQTIRATAKADTLTVFAFGRTLQPSGWQWFHVDTAELIDVTERVTNETEEK